MWHLRRVTGDSMYPTLKNGQIIIVAKPKPPLENQVAVINHNGVEKIKRITKIRDAKIYVEGDNRDSSTDSRVFGWISSSDIAGSVIWPRLSKH